MSVFRVDVYSHEYVDSATGEVLPSLTSFLKAGGLVDDRWFKEHHSERGRVVHTLTADYDLGAIEDPASVVSDGKGYLMGHVKAMGLLQPTWEHIEVPFVNWEYRFGGRPDRVGHIDGGWAVLDVKSGVKTPAAQVQTALQCILTAPDLKVPPRSMLRFVLYLKADGKFKLDRNTDERDFDTAYRLLRTCYDAARAA